MTELSEFSGMVMAVKELSNMNNFNKKYDSKISERSMGEVPIKRARSNIQEVEFKTALSQGRQEDPVTDHGHKVQRLEEREHLVCLLSIFSLCFQQQSPIFILGPTYIHSMWSQQKCQLEEWEYDLREVNQIVYLRNLKFQ